jgi:hypothetical protein
MQAIRAMRAEQEEMGHQWYQGQTIPREVIQAAKVLFVGELRESL